MDERTKEIANLQDYIYLKQVRQNTSLINGKIVFEGIEYTEDEYNRLFPEPVLTYKAIHLDGKQIE